MEDTLIINSFFELSSFKHASLFEGCTFPWQALDKLSAYLQEQLSKRVKIEVPSSVYLVNPELISIGKGTVIEPGAYIQGPCIIGENCQIRHGAYIRGDVLIGDGCVVGHDTEVKHSIFLNGACAAHFNYVGDTILGNAVNLGAGVKCANLRLDHQSVFVTYGGERINTGLKKMGAIVGDGAQIGCNCVVNPGTLIGKNSFCFPCLNVYGYIPDHAKVKPSQKNIIVE